MSKAKQDSMRTPHFVIADDPVPDNVAVKHALLLDVFVGTHRSELVIRYDGCARVELDSADPADQFRRLVGAFASGHNPQGVWRTNLMAHGNPRSSMSLRINHWSYVAFRLTSKRSNLRFTTGYYPLSVEAGSPRSARPNAGPLFYATAKVRKDGRIIDAGAVDPDCNTAFFVVDGTQFDENAPDERFRFNLHLDVIQSGDRAIPIIIDPDVGFPEGIPRS